MLIEHDMPLITSVSDRMVALELGHPMAIGTPEAVIADPRVVASYLGSDEATINRSSSGAAIEVEDGEIDEGDNGDDTPIVPDSPEALVEVPATLEEALVVEADPATSGSRQPLHPRRRRTPLVAADLEDT